MNEWTQYYSDDTIKFIRNLFEQKQTAVRQQFQKAAHEYETRQALAQTTFTDPKGQLHHTVVMASK